MSQRMNDEILQPLQLDDSVLGDVETVSVVETEGGELAETSEKLSIDSAVAVDKRVAREMSFELFRFEHSPGVLLVVAPKRELRVVTSSGERSDGVSRQTATNFVVEPRAAELPVALVDDNDEGLLLAERQGELVIGQILRLPASLLEPLELHSDIETWSADSEDQWLRREVENKLQFDDPFEHLVAVGLLYRLRPPEERIRSEDAVERLLAGERLPNDEPILRWAGQLEESAVRRLVSLTMAATRRLRDELHEMARDIQAGEVVLNRDIRSVLHRRDDIASALVMLEQSSSLERLVGPVTGVDDVGEAIISALLEDFDVERDRRLARAISVNPGGWWTGFVDDAARQEHDESSENAEVVELAAHRQDFQIPDEVIAAAAASSEGQLYRLDSDDEQSAAALYNDEGRMKLEISFDEDEPRSAAVVVGQEGQRELDREVIELDVDGQQAYAELGTWSGAENVLQRLVDRAVTGDATREELMTWLEISYE